MDQTEWRELPAHDGPAGIGKLPSFRLVLMIEILAGQTRKRAEARQGLALERSFGRSYACHRNRHFALCDPACQQDFLDIGHALLDTNRLSATTHRGRPEWRQASVSQTWRAPSTRSNLCRRAVHTESRAGVRSGPVAQDDSLGRRDLRSTSMTSSW
jgi:hypothetical protein